jgi:hypothetical protein
MDAVEHLKTNFTLEMAWFSFSEQLNRRASWFMAQCQRISLAEFLRKPELFITPPKSPLRMRDLTQSKDLNPPVSSSLISKKKIPQGDSRPSGRHHSFFRTSPPLSVLQISDHQTGRIQ